MDEKREYYLIAWGRGSGQRIATGIFTFTNPENQEQKRYNREALILLEQKRAQMVLDQQSVGTGYIPAHKYKANFLDYMEEYVKANMRIGNRHLACCLTHFRRFLGKDKLPPIDLTENLCFRFRQYLLDKLNGECPANYFGAFKRILKAATKEGYFRMNPCEDVKSKENKNRKLKQNLESEDYLKLLETPHFNEEVREAFIFCCYSGLRFCDVKCLNWEDIDEDTLTTKIIQSKTGEPLRITFQEDSGKASRAAS